MKTTSAMELLTLFHKSDYSDINLTVFEHKLLSVLLTFVNRDVSQGYKAWPATELLVRRTGIKTTTLTKARKSLLREKFLLQIVPNAGPGRSCIYYINPDRIIELAEKAGSEHSGRVVAKAVLPEVKEIHKRNTSGLKHQPEPPKQPVAPPTAQDDDCPWWASEEAAESVVVAPEPISDGNADGSPKFFKNGQRRYSWDDVMEKMYEEGEDQPF